MKKIRLCIINRNFPPEDCATGFHALQLAKYLHQKDLFSIQLVCVNQRTDKSLNPFQQLSACSIYAGKNKTIRLISSFLESFHLCWLAKRAHADFYIVLTDPPFLSYFASVFFKNTSWALWSMDLYPYAFAANKLVSESNLFYRHILQTAIRFPPSFFISLGHRQAQFINKLYEPVIPYIPIPVGIEFPEYPHESDAIPSFEHESSKIYLTYSGNIGEAHDHNILFELCRNLNPEKFTIILSVYGSKKADLSSKMSVLPQVKIVDRLSSLDMKRIDVQIISLKQEWTHICVPSRALTAISHGHHVIYFGSRESDSWEYISEFGFYAESAIQAITHLETIEKKELFRRKALAKEKSLQLKTDLEAGRKNLLDKIFKVLDLKNHSSTS